MRDSGSFSDVEYSLAGAAKDVILHPGKKSVKLMSSSRHGAMRKHALHSANGSSVES